MTAASTPKATPMMEQYFKIRSELPKNTLLFFRLGDFYELFFDDAKDASRLLGLTLTERHGTPMAGIPFHAAETYINKLLHAGKKVAICDQVETPQPGKLVKRELTRILTPGTILEDSQVNAKENNYLLAVDIVKGVFQAAWLDLSTGEFCIAEDPKVENLLPVFNALDPKEVVVPEKSYAGWSTPKATTSWLEAFHYFCTQRAVSEVPDYQFDVVAGARSVMETLEVLNLEGFGISKEHTALGAAGAVIAYAAENLCNLPKNIHKIKEYRSTEALLLDPATLRNLEIFKSASGGRQASLLEALDATVTAPGARLLESYLAVPLRDLVELNRRQQCVGDFLAEPALSLEVQSHLKNIRDITRILGRLQNKIHNPRELGGIRDTLNAIPPLKQTLSHFEGQAIADLSKRIQNFSTLQEILVKALNQTLPNKMNEGGVVRFGFDAELDRLLELTKNNKTWISDLERHEQERTGIKNLKVKYNGSFGYCIEITKSNLHLVPDNYIRKQTMTHAERYFTEELKEKEKEILGAEDRALARESFLFQQLVERVLEDAEALQSTSEALAEGDLFVGWAQLALEWDYCRPSLAEDDALEIEQGRHPVVEQMLKQNPLGLAGSHTFVPNDTWLKSSEEQISLITGPNMAGKSTYIRQVALIVLMVQIGSWVPATRCHVGLVDRIFSRVGASDELARGNSTFMVEMNETANILNNATERSLIILDEIGRGTSTYDGLSIAWSVVEHLHAGSQGPKTLFATHYHELTKLESTLERLRNYSVSVKEWNDQIIFVRQVIPGAADRSYGIQVARLAGLPDSIIDRAKVILKELETEGQNLQAHLLGDRLAEKTVPFGQNEKLKRGKKKEHDAAQLTLF